MDDSYQFCFSLYPNDAVCIKKSVKTKSDKAMLKGWFPPEKSFAGVKWSEDEKSITIIGYFKATNATNAQISIEANDKSWPKAIPSEKTGKEKRRKFGPAVRKLLNFQKLEIPLLGIISLYDDVEKEKYVVKQEKRRELAKPSNRKSRCTKH